jgi:putative membrane protein
MRAKVWLVAALALVGGYYLFLGAPVASAHGGIEPGDNLWAAWNQNPLPSLILFFFAYLYVNGLSRWPNPSRPINGWQKASFFTGLLLVFVALQSPIDPLSDHQFFVHQIQHLILRMGAPLLILLGAPLTPMLRGLPQWALQGVVRPVVRDRTVRRGYEIFNNPILTILLFMAALYLWQVPALHNLSVRNPYIHEVMHFTMLITGLRFWWMVLDSPPHRAPLHYGLRVLYLGLIVIPNTLLGAIVTFHTTLLYNAYYDFPQPLNMTPLADQQLGGALLWVVGDMMSVVAAGIVMIFWYQREQEKEPVETASDWTGGPERRS